jgi:hypothetical protein
LPFVFYFYFLHNYPVDSKSTENLKELFMNVWGNVKKFSLGGAFVGAMVIASSLSFTGCLTDDKDDKDTTKAGTAFAASKTLTAGGQGHTTLGSVLELDAGTVLSSSAANNDQDNIDAVLLYYSGAWHLENAVMARASGITHNIDLTDSYDVTEIDDIPYVKVGTMPANQEAAEAAFDAGTKIKGSVIANGDVFLINTTGGAIAVLKVTSVTGATSAGVGEFSFSLLTI